MQFACRQKSGHKKDFQRGKIYKDVKNNQINLNRYIIIIYQEGFVAIFLGQLRKRKYGKKMPNNM